MNKKIFTNLVLFSLALSSCSTRNNTNNSNQTTYDVYSLSTGYFSSSTGKVRLVLNSDEEMPIISPFNTSISGRAMAISNTYSLETYETIQEQFSFDFSYYHALLDRHYKYAYYENSNDSNDNREVLNNVKVINESYGTNTPIKCDDFLYDVLKESYNFTINSNLKFNMFLGTLNEVYEDKMNNKLSDISSLDTTLTLINKATFSSDFDSKTISDIVSTLPNTVEEVKSLLTFDDTKKTVTFNKLDKADKLEISLGGNGKGYATEKIANTLKEKYPSLSLTINSGSSSIKAIGNRSDGKAWNITYTNPVYREVLNVNEVSNPYNPYEVALKHDGEFNISTSGYYEQYFYVYDGSSTFKRRSHIVDSKTGYSHQFFDQISVLIDNTGLADMYTTALMNTDSVEECLNLFNSLNSIYNEKDASIIMCYKTDKNSKDKLFSYSMDDISNTYEINGKKYPSVKLADGTMYSGDYSDFDASTFFLNKPSTLVSTCSHSFNETYLISSSLKDDFSLLDANKYPTYVTNPDNIISNIEVLND